MRPDDAAVAEICDPLNINRYRHEIQTHAIATLENILETHGPEHLTLVLRSIAEPEGNARELVSPLIG
jgi:hypothetical protein